jgi:methionine synthase I (cobalamin-dependent)
MHTLDRFRNGGIVFDGGIGTILIAKGLQPGMPPEEWNTTHPAEVRAVHTAYLEAGADVVETNTFGATPSRMGSFGLGNDVGDINNAAVRLANDAIKGFKRDRTAKANRVQNEDPPLIALSVGPTGKMLPPVGNATVEDIKTEFRHQLECVDEPIDLVLIETIFDLRESLFALEIAKNACSVPIAVTLTFNKNPRGYFTVMGNEAADSIRQLAVAGADIVGANCTLTSSEMVDLARTIRGSTDLPVLCQPNAGQPNIRDGMPVYDQSPREYAEDVIRIFDLGVNAVGGCCGTTPDFVREVSTRRRSTDNKDTTSTH